MKINLFTNLKNPHFGVVLHKRCFQILNYTNYYFSRLIHEQYNN